MTAPEFIGGGSPQTQAVLERLDRDVKPDFVSVLEAVGHGFGRDGDWHRYAFDLVVLDPGRQRFTAGAHHLDGDRRGLRHPVLGR
jgi:hypothetical protein